MKKINWAIGLFALSFACACGQSAYYVQSIESHQIVIDSVWDAKANPDMVALVDSYKNRLEAEMSTPIGLAAQTLKKGLPESPLANFTTDAMLQTAEELWGDIDFSVMNLGGLRSTINKGTITLGNLYEVYPFENCLVLLEMPGQAVRELFANIALQGGQGISHTISLKIKGQAVETLLIGGKPIDPNKIYRVATIDYLAEGNDGLLAFQKASQQENSRRQLRNWMIDHVKRLTDKGIEVAASNDNRIVILPSPTAHTPFGDRRSNTNDRRSNVNEHRSDADNPRNDSLPPIARETQTLLILHNNDTHSRIEPIPQSAPSQAGRGGIVRQDAYVEDVRRHDDPQALLFHCGDFVQGMPYFNLFGGRAEVACMNFMKYDAACLGNHEFDNGLDSLAVMLRAARFPIIATNLDFTDTPLQGLTQPYLILQRKGVKIGLLGLLVSPDGLIAQYNYGNMKYLDPLSSANQTAAFLKEEKGCDLVICLSHLGYNATGEGMGDLTLARETRNIDIILGGHTHTLLRFADRRLNMDGKEVVINQVGDRGIYMGRLDVVMGKSR